MMFCGLEFKLIKKKKKIVHIIKVLLGHLIKLKKGKNNKTLLRKFKWKWNKTMLVDIIVVNNF